MRRFFNARSAFALSGEMAHASGLRAPVIFLLKRSLQRIQRGPVSVDVVELRRCPFLGLAHNGLFAGDQCGNLA